VALLSRAVEYRGGLTLAEGDENANFGHKPEQDYVKEAAICGVGAVNTQLPVFRRNKQSFHGREASMAECRTLASTG